MKKTVLLFLTGLILVSHTFAEDGLRILESMVMPSRILKQDVHFSVCLPKTYYADKASYPVVYLLHGLGDDETSWLEYGQISQFADKAVENGGVVPMIFVMPEGFRTYYVNDYQGLFLYQDMFVKELIPYIDSLFRTKPDRCHRALMGYSMGGFGALTLHLKYPDFFGTAVPLSISIRTNEQYMAEDAAEWDQQWGRLFGGQGQTGLSRITDYYKANCPFFQLQNRSPADFRRVNIYIDNGDKEQTLCRSNEELHILMHKINVPHEFRVRDGGHSFEYWRSALPNALRFISDGFDSKPYRGDEVISTLSVPIQNNQMKSLIISNQEVYAYLPPEYAETNRLYPVLYLTGSFSPEQRKTLAAVVNQKIISNLASPMLVIFLGKNAGAGLSAAIPELEAKLRIRKGYRFRALAAYQTESLLAFISGINQQQFCAFILTDSYLPLREFSDFLDRNTTETLNRLQFYIDTPDKGNYSPGNGNAHMLLRDKDQQHEYRVREGDGGFAWFLNGFPGMVDFAARRFHK